MIISSLEYYNAFIDCKKNRLKREPNKQLTTVVSVNIIDSKSANEVVPKYAKKSLVSI